MFLIVSPTSKSTGNFTTVNRIESHLNRVEMNSKHTSPEEFLSGSSLCPLFQLNRYVTTNQVYGVIFIHAYKSGKVLVCNCSRACEPRFNYGVIFGGTDLNCDVTYPDKLKVIKNCLDLSSFNIVFTQDMDNKVKKLFPEMYSRTIVQAQAVDYHLFRQVDLPTSYEVKKPVVLVMPCSIRPVKNPMYLLDQIAQIRVETSIDVRLLILGPALDRPYYDTFTTKIESAINSKTGLNGNYSVHSHSVGRAPSTMSIHSKEGSTPGAYPPIEADRNTCLIKKWMSTRSGSFIQYIPAIDAEAYYSHMAGNSFFALVNSSESEGMSSALLEGMACGLPVIARDIPGNNSVITHRKNGLLFKTRKQFQSCAVSILSDSEFRENLAREAKCTIKYNHSPYTEGNFYVSMFQKTLT